MIYETATFNEGFNYAYDGNGNRTVKELWTDDPWFLSAYAFPAAPAGNRLLAIGPGSSPWVGQVDPQQTRSHDAAGNVTGIDYTGASSYLVDITLTYGDHGRPIQVSTGTLLSVALGHNALGQRVRMDVTGGSLAANFPDNTLHYDEAGHIIAEYRATGEAYEYLYLDDLPVGFVHYPNAQSAGTLYHYHTDHLGTPRQATDAAGQVVWEGYGSEPFRIDGGGGAGLSPGLRFAGQYYQPETGFYYNYFRDYDPQTGRYLQPDPIGLAGGTNPYAYVNDNPLKYVDPFGLVKCTCTATSTGGAGYVDGRKVCDYRCTADDGRTGLVRGGSDKLPGGDVCYGAVTATQPSLDGRLNDYAKDQLPFEVDSESFLDKYFNYDSNFTRELDRTFPPLPADKRWPLDTVCPACC